MPHAIALPRFGATSRSRSLSLGRLQPHIMTFNIAGLALIALLVVWYVVQVNSLSTKGFQIDALQQQLYEAQQTQQELRLQVSQLQAVSSVEQRVAALGLVPAGTPEHVAATPVARSR